ncbi:expressed unknown protein [Seminavis robusta]|uniref:Uncharacterized protein n=1 Tax=Seminavis robusta TaxID=568900 RepID=A0A9N8HDM4_9STRA|nr:expressed unknown protein [Seminavis robusta]|eukprot:Sro350_g123650.1 n/a (556) ;mRNA; f:9977-13089
MTEAMKNGQSTPSVPTTMTMSNLDTITDNMMTTPIENAANNNINNSNGAIIVLPAVFVATILTLILVKKRRITKGKPIDHVFLGSCLRRCAQEKFQLAGHYNASYFNNHSTTPITPSPEANQKWGRHYRKAYMARQKRITLDREYTHVVFGTFSDEVFEKQQVILAIKANVEAAQFDSWQERRKAGLSVTAYNRIKEESEEEASDYKMHYTQKACCISTLAVPNVADLLVEYGEELVCQWVHGDKDLIEDAKFHNNMVAVKDDVVGLVKAMTAHEKKRVLVHQEPIVVETVEEEDDVEVQVEKMASCDDGYGPGAIVVYTPQLETIAEENDQEQVATIQQQAVVIENLPEDMPHSLKCWTGDNACYNSCWDVVSDMTWESLEDESLEDVNEDNVVEDNVVEDCDEFSLTAEEIAFIERYEAKLQQQQHEPVVEDNVVEDNDDTVQSIDDFDLEDDLEYTLTDADWNALRAMGNNNLQQRRTFDPTTHSLRGHRKQMQPGRKQLHRPPLGDDTNTHTQVLARHPRPAPSFMGDKRQITPAPSFMGDKRQITYQQQH